MKTLHTVVAMVGITAAGTAAYWYQNRASGLTAVQEGTSASARPDATAAGGPGRPGVGPAPGGQGAGGPVVVEVGKVEVVTLQDDAQAVGSVRSRQGVMLRPEVPGRIARIGFADGQRVRRGQVLVQLDDTLQRAELAQAQAQVGLAQGNFNRNRDLVAQNFVSQRVLEESSASLEVARAQVALAQARLDRMRIVAPFDGTAGIRSVSVGDFVKDGADLVNIEDTRTVFVDFRLPERFLSRLKPGQKTEVGFDALPGRAFQARVDAIDPQLDANGRSVAVRASIDNPAGVLRAGMFARVRTVFSVREGALVVPEEALVPQAGKQILIRVVEGARGPTSHRIEARLGMRRPGQVEILEGLAPGDRVVTAGQGRLLHADGQPLKIIELGRDASARPAAASAPASGESNGGAGGMTPASRAGSAPRA
jgi:membrane fusion protein (multidrug efflux system)